MLYLRCKYIYWLEMEGEVIDLYFYLYMVYFTCWLSASRAIVNPRGNNRVLRKTPSVHYNWCFKKGFNIYEICFSKNAEIITKYENIFRGKCMWLSLHQSLKTENKTQACINIILTKYVFHFIHSTAFKGRQQRLMFKTKVFFVNVLWCYITMHMNEIQTSFWFVYR